MIDIYEELEDEFVRRGYEWSIDGVLRPPSADEIRNVVEQGIMDLVPGRSVTIGRLHISCIKSDTYDIYMHMGSVS